MLHAGQDSAAAKRPQHTPRVRWYDARVRTALRRVAIWLNVPWPAVGNFEHLLAYQVNRPCTPTYETGRIFLSGRGYRTIYFTQQ